MTPKESADLMYNLIRAMRNTSSRLKKEDLLLKARNSETFKRILFQTYSPYLRYHIRKIPAKYKGKGAKGIDSDTWILLHKLNTRQITGNVARETLFEHLESLCPSAEKILRLIIQKDMKCGISVSTINKVFLGLIPTFDCQLVDDWDDDRVKYPVLVGPKIDCVRGEFRSGAFYTRRGHKIVGLDHIVKYIESAGKHMELSGELYIPGMSFARASGIIRSNKEEKLNVKYAIFDIPSLSGMPYDRRLKYISGVFLPLGTKPHPHAVHIPHVMAESKEQVTSLFKLWTSRGFEGLVSKNPYGFPKVGKGSYDWMRLVNGVEAEYKVVNVYESEKMPGMLGGIVIEGGIRVGSGFVEDERKRYWEDPSLILGKWATIIAKEKTKAGSLRQPIFKGIRFDI